MIGKSAFHALTARLISAVSRIIGPVTREMARHNASFTSSSTRFLKFGVIVESISFTEYPACNRGVATARIPSGAVASELAKEGKKNTTFFDIGTVPDFSKNRLIYAANRFVTAMSTDCHFFSDGIRTA